MPTIIVQADWPTTLPDSTSLVERVVPNASRDEAYISQLVERIKWALEDADASGSQEAIGDVATDLPHPQRTGFVQPQVHEPRVAAGG